MALLELKGFRVVQEKRPGDALDLTLDGGQMLAVVARRAEAISLLALGISGLLPDGARSEGGRIFTGKRLAFVGPDGEAGEVDAAADLIVADRPGQGREPAVQAALLQALQEARRDRGAAVLILTADLRLPLAMGLEVVLPAVGKGQLRAKAAEIIELPQHDSIRRTLGVVRRGMPVRATAGAPVLVVDGLSRTYGKGVPFVSKGAAVTALEGVGLAVGQGEAVGILGGAGAGKSCLLRAIAGIEKPSAGRVRIHQVSAGYVFSDPRRAFNPALSVGISLTEPLRVEEALLVEEQADKLVGAVRAVGMTPDVLNRRPGSFAAGELQRLALARALVTKPGLLLLDDPTAFLDPAEAYEFIALLALVRSEMGTAMLIASREFEAIRTVVDRVLVLERGRIVEDATPVDLAAGAKSEAARRLVIARYPPPNGSRPERPSVPDEQAGPPDERTLNEKIAPESSVDGADKGPETGEVQLPVEGAIDAAGSVDATNPQTGG